MKTFKKIKRCIKKSIKVGDEIYIIDGSGLALVDNNEHEDMYIVFSYPEITGSTTILKEIKGKVIATKIKDIVTDGVCDFCYGADIIIELGKAKFYTCSQFVKKKKYNKPFLFINNMKAVILKLKTNAEFIGFCIGLFVVVFIITFAILNM